MIRPGQPNKNKLINPEIRKKSTPEILATVLAFISVFIFFLKILFF